LEFSTGVQYGTLHAPNSKQIGINREFVQHVPNVLSIETHTSQRLSHL
jgi:hypothetical protein